MRAYIGVTKVTGSNMMQERLLFEPELVMVRWSASSRREGALVVRCSSVRRWVLHPYVGASTHTCTRVALSDVKGGIVPRSDVGCRCAGKAFPRCSTNPRTQFQQIYMLIETYFGPVMCCRTSRTTWSSFGGKTSKWALETCRRILATLQRAQSNPTSS